MLLCKIFRKIPYTRVAEVDLPEKKFLVFLDCMSQHAFEDSCTLANPCTPNAAESR
jgi:alcohol dehydrogenase class IV